MSHAFETLTNEFVANYLAIFRNSLKFFAGLSPCEICSKPLVDFASC